MNQREIKLPITCSHLKIIAWILLTIGSVTGLSFALFTNYFTGAIGLMTICFFGVVVSIVWAGIKLGEYSEKKKLPQFPFKFRCRCDEN